MPTDTRWSLFVCPVCREPLNHHDGVLRCRQGHSFDISKEGYVNLLLAQQRRSKDPGYNKEMIDGRRAFFDAGHYEPLADGVARLIGSSLEGVEAPVVLDAGCGEGYYLRSLRKHLSAERPASGALLCGIDISKHGVRAAAKRDPAGVYAVASLHHTPLPPSSVDVLLTHFSPVSPEDFRRIVRPGGTVLIGGPGPEHLFGLKEHIYESPLPHDHEDELRDDAAFALADTTNIRYELVLTDPTDIGNLLRMTPYYWSARKVDRERLSRLPELKTAVDVILRVYNRRTDGASAES